MSEPTFDKNGYPTEETLKIIEGWNTLEHPIDEFLDYLRDCWNLDYGSLTEDVGENDRVVLLLSTGGWSGNEDIIYAMEKNIFIWSLSWVESRRGGHYRFEFTRKKK